MLTGVYFRRECESGPVVPEFVNAFMLTDLYLHAASSPRLKRPVIPSIATLSNPESTVIVTLLHILRAIFLIILSNLTGSVRSIKKMSVANTNVTYHDGRALATCESGPPMRFTLPALKTVGWFNGRIAQGEPDVPKAQRGRELGDETLLCGIMKKWTTAHVSPSAHSSPVDLLC